VLSTALFIAPGNLFIAVIYLACPGCCRSNKDDPEANPDGDIIQGHCQGNSHTNTEEDPGGPLILFIHPNLPLAPNNALLPGVNGSLGAVCQVKFAEDVADMAFNGVD